MHYGILNSENTQKHKVPEEICAILYFIRYGIHDVYSRSIFTTWVNMDSKPDMPQETQVDPVSPNWIIKHIINPVEYLVNNVLFGKFDNIMRRYGIQSSLLSASEAKQKENYSRTRKRMVESVKHVLVFDLVSVLKKYGPCPEIPLHNIERFKAIHHYTLCREQNRIATMTGVTPGFIELIFSHLPFIFQNSFEQGHSQICQSFPDTINSTGWDLSGQQGAANQTCDEYQLWVPMPSIIGSATILSFVDLVMNGLVYFPLDSHNSFAKKKTPTKKTPQKKKDKRSTGSDSEPDDDTLTRMSRENASFKEVIKKMVAPVENIWTKTHLDETPQKEQLLEALSAVRELLKEILPDTEKEIMVKNDNPTTSV